MTERVQAGGLQVAKELYDFVNDEALPGAGIEIDAFWAAFGVIVHDLAPRNRHLLAKRDEMQTKIDAWHKANRDAAFDIDTYKSFLTSIGYLLPEGDAFAASTDNVDAEFSTIAGPQLVVPVLNARYALNAANARWGSLYDALYGTDAIGEEDGATRGGGYNPARGAKVIAYARAFLDKAAPLASGSHATATGYAIVDGALSVTLADGGVAGLASPEKLAGYRGDAATPSAVLLVNHGLHVEIVIDRDHLIGKDDAAGVADLVMEAAITTIQDCEDSIAAVDAADKVAAYRNWLGLMKGDLDRDQFRQGRHDG